MCGAPSRPTTMGLKLEAMAKEMVFSATDS